ncbi:MAG: phosphatase PAP2 family protein [Flavobacteriales bacterium]|jgi:membrane-associated phospholipid phosphatase|nr:MAG: phosphatase PAP2 family protein [Flavobacteriales bacterium]
MHWPRPGLKLRALSLLLIGTSVHAQTRHDLRWGREAMIVGVGLGLNTSGLLLAQRPRPEAIRPGPVPSIDRVSTRLWHPQASRASDALFGIAAGAAVLGAIRNQHGEQPLLPVAIIAQSTLLSIGLTTTVKELVRRPRPYLHNSDVPPSLHDARKDHLSFWSGHTANTAAITFACASLVQHSDAPRGWRTAAWIAAAGAPALMGYLRIRAGKHFPTDVIAGYAVGTAVGLGTAYFHRQPK